MPHQQSRGHLAAALAVAVAVTLSGCSLYGSEGGPGGVNAPLGDGSGAAGAESATDAVTGTDGIQRVTVIASDDLRLSPAVVRAHPGTVELSFHNSGVTPHSIMVRPPGPVPSLPASTGPAGGSDGRTGNIGDGETRAVSIDVTTLGRYAFTCVYHATSNMSGTIEVTVAS